MTQPSSRSEPVHSAPPVRRRPRDRRERILAKAAALFGGSAAMLPLLGAFFARALKSRARAGAA